MVRLKSNQTIYIEGKSIVKGTLLVRNRENTVIRGRSILDGSNARSIRTSYVIWTRLISFVESKNIIVKEL
jgi:hypothetical protein